MQQQGADQQCCPDYQKSNINVSKHPDRSDQCANQHQGCPRGFAVGKSGPGACCARAQTPQGHIKGGGQTQFRFARAATFGLDTLNGTQTQPGNFGQVLLRPPARFAQASDLISIDRHIVNHNGLAP